MNVHLTVNVIVVIASTLNHDFALLGLGAVKGNGRHQGAANGAPFEEVDALIFQMLKMEPNGLQVRFVL